MNLTYEEIEEYITIISSGKKIDYIDDVEDIFVFKYPNTGIRLIADSIYHKYYKKALKEGLLPIEEVEKLIVDRGVFTEEDINQVEKLKGQLEAQKVLLSKTLKVKANQDRIKKAIKDLQSKINEILYKKHSKLGMSADTKASEEKTNYMCWACTFNIDDKRIWKTFEEFSNSNETNKQAFIVSHFLNFINGIDIPTVRYISRSTMWRLRYNNSVKTGETLFGIPTVEYSNDQLSLVYWSNFYDQVYSMMPDVRPSDVVIEDDELLDSYMEDYYKDMKQEAQASSQSKKYGKKLSAFDAEEVIVTKSHELYEEIDYDTPKEAKKIKDSIFKKEAQRDKKVRMANADVSVNARGKKR